MMEPKTQVKELTHKERLDEHELEIDAMVSRYWRVAYGSVVNRLLPWTEIQPMGKRAERLDHCNQFWETETYESSRIKVLVRTFLCKDRFCPNCQIVRRMILQNRLLPLMERYQDSLYHMTLTVPDCKGADLYETIRHMARCFKTLVTYLNGNKKVRGIDLTQYDFQGCFRSLEITYDGDCYHPHFEVAAVFGNGGGLEDRHTLNQFSHSQKAGLRLFSDFELIVQRIWWLLINKQRLSYHNIVEGVSQERYSCTVSKFQPDDYKTLLNYVTKNAIAPKWKNTAPMSDEQFRTFYHALNHYRLRQGYGLFYHVKETEKAGDYTEQECQMLEQYIINGEQPVSQYERVGRLACDSQYIILRARYQP